MRVEADLPEPCVGQGELFVLHYREVFGGAWLDEHGVGGRDCAALVLTTSSQAVEHGSSPSRVEGILSEEESPLRQLHPC